MSICPNTQKHCRCQPDEGVMCPSGPTPRTVTDHPAPASTDSSRATAAKPTGYVKTWQERIKRFGNLPIGTVTAVQNDCMREEIAELRERLLHAEAAIYAGIADRAQPAPATGGDLDVEAERREFEKEFPRPTDVEWTGPWYTSRFQPWDAQDYNYRWDGWLKCAARRTAPAPVSTEQAAGAPREDAVLWRALIADTGAQPCRYPCLRDSLADWLADREPLQTS